MSPSNYPPGVTGSEDYFQDEPELKRRKKRAKAELKKALGSAFKSSIDEQVIRKTCSIDLISKEARTLARVKTLPI